LFAFWDFLNTEKVNDWGAAIHQPFRRTSTIKARNERKQAEFSEENPFAIYQAQWKDRYENAA
jgi:hypothetical protein